MRVHGLSCDNVLAYEIVTANGNVLTASASENTDYTGDCEAAAATLALSISNTSCICSTTRCSAPRLPLPRHARRSRALFELGQQAPDELA
jgi:hypothetical protein